MIVAKDPSAVAAKWQQNASAATQSYKTESLRHSRPGQAAARQKNAYVQGVQTNADLWASRRREGLHRRVEGRSDGKGADRYAGGVAAGAPKMAASWPTSCLRCSRSPTPCPPRGTLEQNIARMVQQARETANCGIAEPREEAHHHG